MALAQTTRASLGAFLSAALELKLFSEAQALIQALNEYWKVAGLASEASAWGDRTIRATEPHPGHAPEIETNTYDLWLFVTGTEANRAHKAGDLVKAERIHQRIAASFAGRNSDKADRSLAVAYHQFGMIAQDRGCLDEAVRWYKKSLAINETLSNGQDLAPSYHQLGMIAQERGRLDEAVGWYKKSLAIEEALGNQLRMAVSYHQLGRVAQERGRLDEAEGWYKKSLAIDEVLSDKPGMAASFHQVGRIAQLRGNLSEAEGWYKKSLAIKEALGNQPGRASSYGQLGNLAAERGHSEEAEGLVQEIPRRFRGVGRRAEQGQNASELEHA
jgi:tetratricopeptide (TPR) repeat protein